MPTYHSLSISTITPSSVGASSFIVVLKSNDAPNLSFPIVIGSQEAQSISIIIDKDEQLSALILASLPCDGWHPKEKGH